MALETATCLRQVDALEAGDQRRHVHNGEGEGRGDSMIGCKEAISEVLTAP